MLRQGASLPLQSGDPLSCSLHCPCPVSAHLFLPSLAGFLIFLWYWTIVLQVRKLNSYPSPNSSDSAMLPFSTSRNSAD